MRGLRCVSVAALSAFLVVAGGCSNDDGSESSDSTSTSMAGDEAITEAPDGLVDDDVLIACRDRTRPQEPSERAGDEGDETGFDIDLLRAVARDAGLDLDVRDLPFEDITTPLAAGDCDVVASTVTINDERTQEVDCTEPYVDVDQSLLVRTEDAESYATLVGLKGQRIGVRSGTTGQTYAEEHVPQYAVVVSFGQAAELFAALASGEVAALLQDRAINAVRATQDDGVVLTETFTTGEQRCFAVTKGRSALLDFLNGGLATLKEDGRFDEIYATYFGDAG